MARPCFVIAGISMPTGGVARRTTRFAAAAVGLLHGGLAIASVLACVLFAAVSGSSLTTVVAVGSIAIVGMVRAGYSESVAAGVVCNAGSLGLVIPSSFVFVGYVATLYVLLRDTC